MAEKLDTELDRFEITQNC